jgi:putative SOS response-associated peptidase YedK
MLPLVPNPEETVADTMNERYSLKADLADLTGEFRIDRIEFPYYESDQYAPTAQIPVIRTVGEQRWLNGQRWGLMPYWGKSSIHTDRDSLGDKPYLLSMLAKKRCVVPCSGLLFERMEGKQRRTYRRKHSEKAVFGVAGIFDIWVDSEKNEFPMCTIVSTSKFNVAGEMLPIVLEGEALDMWLDPGCNQTEPLRDLLRSIPEPEFQTEPADLMQWVLK